MNRVTLTCSRSARLLAGFLTFLVSAMAHADEDYRIQPGTLLEIHAIGVPDFRYQVRVDASGEASLPLITPMVVTEMTLAELRALIKAELPSKVYRQRTADGLDALITIMPDEIVVEISEYPPVYVTGDVGVPGAVAFRPNMTVREAIALAGGFDPARSRTFDPYMEAANIRGEQTDAWIEHASVQVRRLGIEAMLNGNTLEDLRGRVAAPLPEGMIDEIAEVEVKRLGELERDDEDERTHVETLISDAVRELSDLEAEQIVARARVREQEALTTRYEYSVTSTRYQEELRHLSYVQERALALASRVADVRRDIHELERRLESQASQRRVALLADLNETAIRLSILDSRILALQEKQVYVGNTGIGTSSMGGLSVNLTLHRSTEAGVVPLPSEENDTLRAGDVVEVMLQRSPPVPGYRSNF